MERRLVLGCGDVGRAVLTALRQWPGRLSVVAGDRGQVDALRDEGVDAQRADPTDPATYPDEADLVLVATDDPSLNLTIAERARDQFAAAYLVAFAGFDAPPETRAAIEATADRVIDPTTAIADATVERTTGTDADRVHELLQALRDVDGKLAVVMHDNPDPDAIASALALGRIAGTVGCSADVCYFGDISHQENRALVNLLGLRLNNLAPDSDISEYGGVALVDHSRPGVNDGLPEGTAVDVVIDHHPPRGPVDASFVDLRSDVGATSTLMARYLQTLDIDPDETVATALLFGIRVDTNDFTREVSRADFEAAAFLYPHADLGTLDRVETPSMSPDVLNTLARAIQNREVRGDALATNVGDIRDRDALAQAADRLLDMEGIRITLVYGFMDSTVYVSGRARGTSVDLGETLRDAFDAIGSAGGHADMAGAQIPLGILGEVTEGSRETVEEIVRDIISGRFFETIAAGPRTQVSHDGDELAFEFSLGGHTLSDE